MRTANKKRKERISQSLMISDDVGGETEYETESDAD
jgi:hypothetical protein